MTWGLAGLLLGLGAAGVGCTPERAASGARTAAPEHEVVVQTRLVGPEAYYFEGALVDARLEPMGPDVEGAAPEVWGPDEVGGEARWSEVPEGKWRLVGSTRVCNGNCGALSGPTDACALDLGVTADTTVVVTYRWGEPCRIAVS